MPTLPRTGGEGAATVTREVLQGKRVVLGVTGSIAAFKAASVASALTQAGALVDAIMTPAATELIRPLTFQALTQRPVSVEMFGMLNQTEISTSAWGIMPTSSASRRPPRTPWRSSRTAWRTIW